MATDTRVFRPAGSVSLANLRRVAVRDDLDTPGTSASSGNKICRRLRPESDDTPGVGHPLVSIGQDTHSIAVGGSCVRLRDFRSENPRSHLGALVCHEDFEAYPVIYSTTGL